MMQIRKTVVLVAAAMTMVMQVVGLAKVAYADEKVTIEPGDVAMSVSPMRESVVLNPGDEYRSSFMVSNPGVSEHDLYYKVEVQPFYVDENYNPVYVDVGDNSQIAEWITIESGEKGLVHPNEAAVVEFTVKVPKTAPAGGQYASLTVSTDFAASEAGAVNINEAMSMAHLVLAEIAGNTISSGEILDAGIDSFLLGGKIRTHSMVRNTGNVHALATYNMEVKSVFSDEVIYELAKEPEPETHYVLPDRTLYNETVWADTPTVGIFDVKYTVEFLGMVTEVTQVVIVCPWWLMVILVLPIVLMVIRIVMLIRMGRKKRMGGVKYGDMRRDVERGNSEKAEG